MDDEQRVDELLERDPYTVELDELLAQLRDEHRLRGRLPVVMDPRATWRNTVA